MTNKNGILRQVFLLTVISTLPGVQFLEAGNITYDINISFPGADIDHNLDLTLTGNVTTDGAVGLLNYKDILSEHIYIKDPHNPALNYTYDFDISTTKYASTNDTHDDPRYYWPQFFMSATETSLFLMPKSQFCGGSFNYTPWRLYYLDSEGLFGWNKNGLQLDWPENQWLRSIQLDGVTPFEFATVQNSSAVPEPTSLSLLSVGSLALVGAAWRRRRGKTLVTHS